MTDENKDEYREIVVPGEVLSNDPNMLPGRGAVRDKDKISAIYIGLKDIKRNYVNVVPLRGIYTPSIGDTIIGKVIDKSPVKWYIDINAKNDATLRPSDVIDRNDKRLYGRQNKMSSREIEQQAMSMYTIGDILKCKILSTDRVSNPVVTTLGEGLGLISDGICIQVDVPKIPRIIGKRGSMIRLLKDLTSCKLFVSKNGRIWIKGRTEEHEKLAIDVINKIQREAHTMGLTDRIQFYINEQKKIRGID